jgi:hypothetical protein
VSVHKKKKILSPDFIENIILVYIWKRHNINNLTLHFSRRISVNFEEELLIFVSCWKNNQIFNSCGKKILAEGTKPRKQSYVVTAKQERIEHLIINSQAMGRCLGILTLEVGIWRKPTTLVKNQRPPYSTTQVPNNIILYWQLIKRIMFHQIYILRIWSSTYFKKFFDNKYVDKD